MFIFCFFLNGKKWCDRSWYVCLPVYTNGCQTPHRVSHTVYMYRSQFPVPVSVGRESGGGGLGGEYISVFSTFTEQFVPVALLKLYWKIQVLPLSK